VTGPPYFTTSGVPVVWYTNQLLYFTDPGDLSSNVNHAAADALVAAAAAVWNVPTASLVLSHGGALDEHVSGADAFLGANGPIFPADVESSNYLAKQIAVIYDSDGSVTDLLLGNGASDPFGLPAERRDRERRLDCASRFYSARDSHSQWPMYRTCSSAADAAAVSVDEGVWPRAWPGVVADQ
jgi:hypothetical protein